MRKPDDSSLTVEQRARIRAEAERALRGADAFGRFPTPIADIMQTARVEEVPEDVLNEGFVAAMRKKAGSALKRALSKVLGLFDARARLVFIDRTLLAVKQSFIRLHETAHGYLAWQRDLYAVVEDCEQTIDPATAELFDREANAFASEVLFQLDGFSNEANDRPFGLSAPLNLCRKYGASVYSSIRRYVSHSRETCAVLILDPPQLALGDGFRCNLRRVVCSPSFLQVFGDIAWPESFTPSDSIGAMVPVGNRKMSGKRTMELQDRAGKRYDCTAEAFTQGYQVFILFLAPGSPRTLLVPVAGGM